MTINLTKAEVDLFRQWFDTIQDVNPKYLGLSDYLLAKKVHRALGQKVPTSITLHISHHADVRC